MLGDTTPPVLSPGFGVKRGFEDRYAETLIFCHGSSSIFMCKMPDCIILSFLLTIDEVKD